MEQPPPTNTLLDPVPLTRAYRPFSQPRPTGPGCTAFYSDLSKTDKVICLQMPPFFHSVDPEESHLAEAQEFVTYATNPQERRIAARWILECMRHAQQARSDLPWGSYPACCIWLFDHGVSVGEVADVGSFSATLANIVRGAMGAENNNNNTDFIEDGVKFFQNLLEIVMRQDRLDSEAAHASSLSSSGRADCDALLSLKPYASFFYVSLTEREQRACEAMPAFFHTVDPCDDFLLFAVQYLQRTDTPAQLEVGKRWVRQRLSWKELELKKPDMARFPLCSDLYRRNEEKARSRVSVPTTPFTGMLWNAIEQRRMEPRFMRQGLLFMLDMRETMRAPAAVPAVVEGDNDDDGDDDARSASPAIAMRDNNSDGDDDSVVDAFIHIDME
jgi:hypothetical protein